jgi:hypothetical protein
MTWLLPSALAIAGVAAIGVVAVHFVARSRPLAEPLPTARFIPQHQTHSRGRSAALTDRALLALRILALLAIGAAVAGPVVGAGGPVQRIVLIDRSRAVANIAELRDSVRAFVRQSDFTISFDSAASAPAPGVAAGSDSTVLTGARGSLSAALSAAVHAAGRIAVRADSVELVIVSPMAQEEIDDATTRLRAVWPGRIHVVPVAARQTKEPPGVEVRGPPNDAVAAAIALMGARVAEGGVRVLRGRPGASDSAWARVSGHVLVLWPASDTAADWPRRQTIDAVGGVVSPAGTLIARFPRPWVLTGTAVARWIDGEPAAVEKDAGGGCVREVGVLIDEASDIALRAPFHRFTQGLVTPCGGARLMQPVSIAMAASLAGRGQLAASGSLRDRRAERSPAAAWLLALGAVLLIAELALRRSPERDR